MNYNKYLVTEKKFDTTMSHAEQTNYLIKNGDKFVMKKDYKPTGHQRRPSNGDLKKGDTVWVNGNTRGGTENFDVKGENYISLGDYGKPFDFINKYCEV